MTTTVRRPVAAGTFYPDDVGQLEIDIRAMLDRAEPGPTDLGAPFGLVVPHAGYRYSGPVAASAYRRLADPPTPVRRIALFGPAHFQPVDGAMVSGARAWRTPLGDVEVDDELRGLAIGSGASVGDRPHASEHALEVQLPWLQLVLGEVTIVPVAVGRMPSEVAADLIGAVGEAADLVVISTDLSHYLTIEAARRRDRRTADAILSRNPEAIEPDDACGVFALRGALEVAERRQLDVTLLDLGTSGDTAGGGTRVVGYGAFAISARG